MEPVSHETIAHEPVLPPEAKRVGLARSPHLRVYTVMILNLLGQAVLIGVIAHGMKSVDGAHVQHDVSQLRSLFLIGSIGAFAIGIFLAVWSVVMTKRQLLPLSTVTRSVAEGNLHPDIRDVPVQE